VSVSTERPFKRYGHYIGGEWRRAATEETFESVNPATGEAWYQAAQGGDADVDRAVRAARAAFEGVWSEHTPLQRGKLLRNLGDLIAEVGDDLAIVETRDNGKLIREMRGQMRSLPEWFYYFSGAADKIHGETIPTPTREILNYTLREPVGVVGAITPWNSPLLLTALKLAPALAAGNTIVIKPSEHASASILELMPLVERAGFPPGVVNAITGDGRTGHALAAHPGVDKVAFTGGTETGRRVGVAAMEHLAPITLELGGKSPQLVFSDADLDAATFGIIAGVFAAAGQTCVAGSRALVQHSVYEEVIDRVAERTERIRIGDPLEDDTELGPLAFKEHRERVAAHVAVAESEGGRLVLGGKQPPGLDQGWFYEPTIFADLSPRMSLFRNEVFGPVLGVLPFKDEDEAVEIANDTRYGLAAGIWTQNLPRAHRVAAKLRAGTVWINTYRTLAPSSPFGGFGDSGIGKENGLEVLREYTRLKSVWVNTSSAPPGDPFVLR
jgi:(Z)-2-((N-methylformamido)methylene)-5-hydroxybutyrolactone dehydrogenase